MKHSLSYVLALLFLACGASKESPKEEMLLGWVDRPSIERATYPQFRPNYDTIAVSQDIVEMIREVHDGIDYVVFFGTWCKDSKREVPRFHKVVDLAGIGAERIRYYAVDRSKKSSDGLTEQYNIEFVPTFIFLKDGKEIGRIVEKPQSTLEDDMLSILAGAQAK
jgi:thiol-disulfide isomerase/thioredoxin